MPVMNGTTATGIIRHMEEPLHQHIPIIALTANALKGDREICLESGMDDYLPKPVMADALYKMIERWTMHR